MYLLLTGSLCISLVSLHLQVVYNVGLCICLYDVTKLEDSYIFPGDGASHTKGDEEELSLLLRLQRKILDIFLQVLPISFVVLFCLRRVVSLVSKDVLVMKGRVDLSSSERFPSSFDLSFSSFQVRRLSPFSR